MKDAEPLLQFGKQLQLSPLYSVDRFLENRPDLMEAGKFCMANAIIKHESDTRNKFWQIGFDHWLRYLFDKMCDKFEIFSKNKVSFITFNYDRTVEHFLHESLKHTFNRSDRECAEVVKKFDIIHVHGKVGLLPWETNTPEGEFVVPYGKTKFWRDSKDRKNLIESLKIVHDEVEGEELDNAIRGSIQR